MTVFKQRNNSHPHSAGPHGQPLVRRRAKTILLPLLAIVTGASLLAPAVSAQTYVYPSGGCVATMENHSSLVDNNGNYTIPNIPASPGQYLVHIACPQPDGSLLTGVSPYINLQAVTNGIFQVPLIPMGLPQAEPNSLVLLQLSGTLSAVGATVQLQAQAILPNGNPFDVTPAGMGTSYFSSNTAVATVSQSGIVTATGPGTATITANNDGLTATIMLTSFSALDSDGDGMPDAWEIANGLNPYDPSDAVLDPDGDGLTNLQEYQLGTNPHVYDTDGDGLSDGQEVQLGTNPLVADTDGDGLTDGQEVKLGTNPLNPDTDGDGIPDGIEVKIGTNPLVADVTTSVTGNVSNGDGTPHPGASVVVLTYFTAQTDSSGTFTILNVPVTLGNISAQAEAVVGTQVYSGSSQATVPVGHGSTNVGTISLGPNSGQVSGVITTPDNKPDQGVQVIVTDGADTRTAVTDGTGLYAVTGLQAGTAMVSAFDPATSLRGQGVGTLNGKTPATVNIKLSAFGTVSGTVTNLTGANVGAGVTVTISGAFNATTTTDNTGKYAFSFVPLGAVTIVASDNNGNRGQSTGLVTATNQTLNANIQYLGQGTVTGTVLDGTNQPVPGAAVTLHNYGLFSQSLSSTANSLGVFSFSNVFIGPISLGAVSPTNSDGGSASTNVNTNGQAVTQNINLQPTATITGTVYRADGKTVVPNASLYVAGSASAGQANASGVFTLGNIPLGGGYLLIATDPTSADEGSAGFSLTTAGSTVPVNLKMLGLGTLNVTVVDGGGNPSPGAQVAVQTGPPFSIYNSGIADANGLYTVTPQLAGSLTINATSNITSLSGTSSATLQANGTANVTVTLQSAGTIQGMVVAANASTPVAGAVVLLDNGRSITTDSTGTFSFTNVASGTHSLVAQDYRQNLLGTVNAITITSQGQIVTQNIVIVGRGTISGQVTNADGSPAPLVTVTAASATSADSNSYGTATDSNGNYSIPNVPIGPFSVIAMSHTATTNSYGSGNGVLNTDGSSATVNIQLTTSLVPTSTTFADANGEQYLVRENGGIFDGSFAVFAGDTNLNQGGSVLSLSTGTNSSVKFAGSEFSTASLNGRQLSIEQDGIYGVNVVRRVYVPSDGYFARYLELVHNPGTQSVQVALTLSDYFRPINQDVKINGVTFQNQPLPKIIQTSSGDTTFSIANPNADNWITLGGPTNQDPFLPDGFADTLIPTVSDVFSGPGAPLEPTSAGYIPDASNTFSTVSETYQVTVKAGATVGILHFLSQENVNQAGVAAATRLVQLPPEALAGLTQSDLAAIQNFVVPAQGVSTLAALPALTNSVSGTVYASDGAIIVPQAEVFLESTDPIYARTYTTNADGNGNFVYTGTPGGLAIPNESFNLYAYHPTSVTPLTAYCAQFSQEIAGGCAVISSTFNGSFSPNTTSATQNVLFSNTGIITGTISRGPTVLNVSGTVTISGGPLNTISQPVAPDGTYTVTGVLPGSYTVLVNVTNTLLSGSTSAVVTAGNTTVANINIVPSGNVQGTVTRSDGTPAINDIVYLRTPSQGSLQYQVDTSGHYAFTDIPDGTYTLNCYDNVTQSAVTATVVITTNATVIQNLQLLSTGTVTGTVTSNDGSSVLGLPVTLTSTTTTTTQNLSATTTAGGAFTFNLVNPGAIVVHATNSEGLQGSGQTYLPTAGQTVSTNVQLISSGNVTGTVFQGDGVTPAAGIQVSISPAPLTGSSTTSTNSSGVYNFTSVPYGNFNVYASNTANGDQGQANGAVQANGQLRTINLSLNGFGSITINVLDANANPVSGAAVSLTSTSISHQYTATTNSAGVAFFPSVYAGQFFVAATSPVNNLSGYGSGTVSYKGTASVTVRLQALATISGTVFLPDGVTPAPGVVVQLNPAYGPTTTSNAAGAFQFANIGLGNYNLQVRDAAGIVRASASNIALQTNAAVVTQNLTEIGIGSVSGTVTNIDGTPAANVPFTISNANGTFSQNASTAADGTYSVAEVPVGAFSVTLYSLPANQTGYGNSTMPQNGARVTLNIRIQSSTVTLPATLEDADSFSYIIQTNGTYITSRLGGLIPFYYAQPLTLLQGGSAYAFGSGNSYGSPTTATQTLSGQQIEINEPSLLGLSVTRKIYVPANGYFARRLEVLSNPTSSPITVQVQIGASGYDRYATTYPRVITSSGGTAAVSSSTRWTVDNSGLDAPYPQNQPAIANIFAGTNAPVGVASVSDNSNCNPYYPGQTVDYCFLTWTYQYQPVTVPANGQVSFLFFTAQESTNAQATDAAQRLVQLPAEALAGISSVDAASIQNFVLPASPLPAVTPPPINIVSGVVTASDGTTPVQNALVFLNSTDLLYGFGASTIGDVNGNYTIPSVLATSYSAYAIDPLTTSTSPTFTGTIPANTMVQTQNITFNNTGVVQGTVSATGAGTFTGGTISIVYQCSNGNYYCQGPSTTFGPDGIYKFLTVQAGNIQISANVTTAQGGTIMIPGNYGAYTVNVPAQQTTQVNFTIPPTGSLTGLLTNADGTPASNIVVTANPTASGIYSTTTTDANGRYTFTSIPIDTYTVSAKDATTGDIVSGKVTLTQDNTSTLNLQFLGKDTINIKVTFTNGNPAPQYTYVYAATSTIAAYNYVGATDANGNISLTNIPTGTLNIRVYYPNQGFYTTTPFNVTGTNQTENVTVVLPPVGTIQGTLTNADGTPVPNTYVSAVDSLGQYSGSAQTDSVGTFAFSPVPAQRLITFSASYYSSVAGRNISTSATKTLSADGATATVNLRFPGLATVVVTVLNNGTPVSTGGQVYLHSSDNAQNPAQNLNSNGVATFNNVSEASFIGYYTYYGGPSLGSTTFTVSPGNDNGMVNVTINTTPTGTVQGQVFAADGVTALTNNVNVTFTDVLTNVSVPAGFAGSEYTLNPITNGTSGYSLTASVYAQYQPVTQTQTGNLSTAGQVITQNFTLPVGVVSGTVFLNDGVTPLPFANVYGSQLNYSEYTTADANGNYQLVGTIAGPITIQASDQNGVVGAISTNIPTNTSVLSGQNVSLGPVGTVMGIAYDTSNNLLINAQVEVDSSGNNSGFTSYTTTDSNGNYFATDIPVGNITVTVTVTAAGCQKTPATGAAPLVSCGHNTTVSNTGVLTNNGDSATINVGNPGVGSVFGTVYDENGNPSQGATVVLTSDFGGAQPVTATTDVNGMYNASGVVFGNITAVATLNDGFTTPALTAPLASASTPVEIDLNNANPGVVSGLVTDVNGNPIPNLNVALYDTTDPNSYTTSSTDQNGNFYFGSIDPGSITIQALDKNNNIIGHNTASLGYGGNVTINVQTSTVGAGMAQPANGSPRTAAVLSSPPTASPLTTPSPASTAQQAPPVQPVSRPARRRSQPTISQLPLVAPAISPSAVQTAALQGVHP